MALGSLTGAVAETGYETYVRKKHQEGIPSAEINLFSFICSETAVSAVLLARGMKSIRDRQPQKAAKMLQTGYIMKQKSLRDQSLINT